MGSTIGIPLEEMTVALVIIQIQKEQLNIFNCSFLLYLGGGIE